MGSFIGELTGANKRAADAAQGAAMERQRVVNRGAGRLEQFSEQAISQAESPQELAALEKSFAAQERNLQSQERIAQSIDPTILAAAQNLTKLLGGQESGSQGLVRQQRQRQRQQLQNQLREQLGPGGETSAAGQQALQRFDLDSSEQIFGAGQAQQGTLSNLLSAGVQQRGAFGAETARLGTLGSLFGQRADRLSLAQSRGGQLSQEATKLRAGSAGAEFTGSAIRAGQSQAIGGEAFGALMSMGSAALTGGLSSLASGAGSSISGFFSSPATAGGGGGQAGPSIDKRISAGF